MDVTWSWSSSSLTVSQNTSMNVMLKVAQPHGTVEWFQMIRAVCSTDDLAPSPSWVIWGGRGCLFYWWPRPFTTTLSDFRWYKLSLLLMTWPLHHNFEWFQVIQACLFYQWPRPFTITVSSISTYLPKLSCQSRPLFYRQPWSWADPGWSWLSLLLRILSGKSLWWMLFASFHTWNSIRKIHVFKKKKKFQAKQMGWRCNSVGTASDRHAAEAGSIPGAARDFSPGVNRKCRISYGVCAITCTNICEHVKDPKHWQPYHCLNTRKYRTLC